MMETKLFPSKSIFAAQIKKYHLSDLVSLPGRRLLLFTTRLMLDLDPQN